MRLLRDLARETARTDTPFVTTFFGNPYTSSAMPELPAMLLTYDFYDQAEARRRRARSPARRRSAAGCRSRSPGCSRRATGSIGRTDEGGRARAMMLRDRLLARLAESSSPDHQRLAEEVLGIRHAPARARTPTRRAGARRRRSRTGVAAGSASGFVPRRRRRPACTRCSTARAGRCTSAKP